MTIEKYKTIAQMEVGEKGLVSSLNGIEPLARHRFMDLGIAPYARIELVKRVNKRLFIIDVDDVEICIRRMDADRIQVQI